MEAAQRPFNGSFGHMDGYRATSPNDPPHTSRVQPDSSRWRQRFSWIKWPDNSWLELSLIVAWLAFLLFVLIPWMTRTSP